MSRHWQTPRACTVIGAAHRRQGRPCQDASLSVTLHAPCGADLQLMAVADGHGASRYWLSQVGSQLACEQAQHAVAQALQRTPLAAEAGWRALLEEQLPAAICKGWRAAIEADWQLRPEANGQSFSALPYGCTLGLVLMAPAWWGCTGLGDWDLVAVDSGGVALLRSEESSCQAGGEATASLCLPQAERLCADRAQLEQLEAEPLLRGLLLSTDGVRKSCATDDDFLMLCAQVIQLQEPEKLEQGLTQISAEGSGDDVSLAIGLRSGEGGGSASSPSKHKPQRQRWIAAAATGLLALAGLAGSSWWLLRRGRPTSAPSLSAPLPAAVEAEARHLCLQPARIQASLNQRQAQFQRLLRDPGQAPLLLTQAVQDPLGAVIAASAQQRLRSCPALQQALQQQWQQVRAAEAEAGGKMPAAAAPP